VIVQSAQVLVWQLELPQQFREHDAGSTGHDPFSHAFIPTHCAAHVPGPQITPPDWQAFAPMQLP